MKEEVGSFTLLSVNSLYFQRGFPCLYKPFCSNCLPILFFRLFIRNNVVWLTQIKAIILITERLTGDSIMNMIFTGLLVMNGGRNNIQDIVES
jgi:hypothetical protein